MNCRAFEFSFSWLFAIIVGAVIIFIAIYATTSIVGNTRTETDSKIASQLGILLNPVETNLEEAQKATIVFPEETRFFNGCRETGNFGRQVISTSTKSGIGEEWQQAGAEISFFNKYIFSSSTEQGEELYVLAKPLEMPYKVADLIFITTDNYCFVNPPKEIEDEINNLQLENINITEELGDCPRTTTVCFGGFTCDINVNTQTKKVNKDGQELSYEGPLIYGAIFSDPGIYECQIKRIAKRTSELAHLYADKTQFLSSKGCSAGFETDLRTFASINSEIQNSADYVTKVVPAAEEIDRRNENLACRLY